MSEQSCTAALIKDANALQQESPIYILADLLNKALHRCAVIVHLHALWYIQNKRISNTFCHFFQAVKRSGCLLKSVL